MSSTCDGVLRLTFFFAIDYTSVVLAIMIVLSILNWLFYARKNYHGPNVTLFARDVE